ncbi:tRNA adenosine(34) deaminase TadA [Woodsholea maritima]|uniref:tRNA adenosine(34) deaminase TadA n=1 Tax=Woodsholea maritima TaxID=240237 RepID=UPI00035F2588|nr:tRNA adenosine(34) deaminase TadA [Woodsholea maritima]
MTPTREEMFMRLALDEARLAAKADEAPIGAVIVDPATDEVLARGHNTPIASCDPTAHAELTAIRLAGAKLGNYRLMGLELYVTLEPCAMCAGAISHARLGRVIYGAGDEKGGAIDHGPRFFAQPTCHWRPDVVSGICEEVSADLLRGFFKAKREAAKALKREG